MLRMFQAVRCTCILQIGIGQLHSAVRENDIDTIERLISAGADLNIRDTVSIRLVTHFTQSHRPNLNWHH